MGSSSIGQELYDILTSFDIPGDLLEVDSYGGGHLHRTLRGEWAVDGVKRYYIHQCINTSIFRDVDAMMHNIHKAAEHLKRKIEICGSTEETTLEIVPTRDGALYGRASDGSCWRTYTYVPDSTSYEFCVDAAQAFEAARAFGRFNLMLSDLDPATFRPTIPDFIDTPKRYNLFRDVVARDPERRLAEVQREVEFAYAHEDEAGTIMRGLHDGAFPWKVTHNDMKLNNLLFSSRTGKAKCVVDLDTIMPGSNLYDFGDLVRTSSMHVQEDETDLAQVNMDIGYFEALVGGFVSGIGEGLREEEIDVLHIAPRVLAFTMGIRFLTDYIGGDTYYKIHRPSHNLDRCRCQFALVESMERQEQRMRQAVRNAL